MRVLKFILACTAFLLAPLSAEAAALSIVNVSAPAINCVFSMSCTVAVSDSVGNFIPPPDGGNARLQTRTYPGQTPMPGGGTMAYEYRMDLTATQAITSANCVKGFSVEFGPVASLPYNSEGNFDVFVVTSGGLGTVGLASAVQNGSTIIFTFSSPVCPGQSSYFFGLASATMTPIAGSATLYYSQGGTATTDDQMP